MAALMPPAVGDGDVKPSTKLQCLSAAGREGESLGSSKNEKQDLLLYGYVAIDSELDCYLVLIAAGAVKIDT